MKGFLSFWCLQIFMLHAAALSAAEPSLKELPGKNGMRVFELSNGKGRYILASHEVPPSQKWPSSYRLGMQYPGQGGFDAAQFCFLEIDGIPLSRLKPREIVLKKSELVLNYNFDGTTAQLRFRMRPDSPVLWGELNLSGKNPSKQCDLTFYAQPSGYRKAADGKYHRRVEKGKPAFFFLFDAEVLPGAVCLVFLPAEGPHVRTVFNEGNHDTVRLTFRLNRNIRDFSFGLFSPAEKHSLEQMKKYVAENPSMFHWEKPEK